MVRAVVKVMGLLSVVLLLSSCYATVGRYGEYEGGVYPSDAYIATTAPVYYDGRPSYWYGNQWYYRDGGAWRSYRQEPTYLHDYRSRVVAAPQYYGRAHGGGYRHR